MISVTHKQFSKNNIYMHVQTQRDKQIRQNVKKRIYGYSVHYSYNFSADFPT